MDIRKCAVIIPLCNHRRGREQRKSLIKESMGACEAHYLTPISEAGMTTRTVTLSLLERRSVTMTVTATLILKRIGLSDTEELVRVELVGNKSKKTKLDFYTPSGPNKITLGHPSSRIISDSKREQQKYSPRSEQKQGVTAVLAVTMGLKSPTTVAKRSQRRRQLKSNY